MADLSQVELAVPLDKILEVFGWSRRKFFYWRQELKDAGVIFYRNEGRPPRRRVYAFPSRIQKFISLKSSKGEDC